MKKLSVIFGFFFCIFASARLSYGVVSVKSINNDIQKDQVNLEAIGITDTESTSQTSISGEHIQSFNSDILINKDGTINVKEKIVYDFSDFSRHGIYRSIPYTKTNSDGKKYRMDLQPLSVLDENGKSYRYTLSDLGDKIEIKIGDPNRTITGLHTDIISYQISGALTYFSDHDELYWNCTGNEWAVPMSQITCQVTLPVGIGQAEVKKICYTGYKGSTITDCDMKIEDNVVSISSKNVLSANEGLTIVVGFPKNLVAVLEPKEVISFWQTLLGKLVGLGIALLILFWYIIYPIKIILKWIFHGRDPSTSSGQVQGVVSAWFDPPKTSKGNRFMTPGEVGTLGDETADMKDISATIVDLARRGYFRIEERKKGDFYFVKTAEFENDARLLVFEQKLLKGLFGAKKSIHLKDEDLYKTVEDTKTNLYQQTVDDGLFSENPQSIRTFYTVIAVLALSTGNFFLAAVAFLFGRNMPRKTVAGVNAFHIGKSLKNFLSSQERQLTFQAKNQMMFEKLLPYAIVFGVETVWAKRFADIDMKSPDWYQGYSTTNFNSVILASSLSSSLHSFSSAARPPTSTSSTSGFSSGFSGGFSGGGGGGGGGGSW